jgi:cytochrome b561
MKWGNSTARYGAVAIALHWILAGAIVFMLGLGLLMTRLEETHPYAFPLFQLHKSIGLTILVLTIARLLWRALNPVPELPDRMRPWERASARTVHAGLYALMIGVPLLGWATVSASVLAVPTIWFGLFEWPHFGFLADLPRAERRPFEEALAVMHSVFAFLMVALAAVHASAALKHHFKDKDDVLKRMLPWTKLGT